MRRRNRIIAIGISSVAILVLAACGGGGGDDADDAPSSPAADAGANGVGGAGGSGAESAVTVTVDGTEYAVTTVQTCETETDVEREEDLKMFGFAESGERVELSFRYQGADESPSGTEQYYGSVGIASGETSAQVVADEPFEFLSGDRATVSGSVEMETTDGEPVDVAFDITCS